MEHSPLKPNFKMGSVVADEREKRSGAILGKSDIETI
jgi:hypothetical protein